MASTREGTKPPLVILRPIPIPRQAEYLMTIIKKRNDTN